MIAYSVLQEVDFGFFPFDFLGIGDFENRALALRIVRSGRTHFHAFEAVRRQFFQFDFVVRFHFGNLRVQLLRDLLLLLEDFIHFGLVRFLHLIPQESHFFVSPLQSVQLHLQTLDFFHLFLQLIIFNE